MAENMDYRVDSGRWMLKCRGGELCVGGTFPFCFWLTYWFSLWSGFLSDSQEQQLRMHLIQNPLEQVRGLPVIAVEDQSCPTGYYQFAMPVVGISWACGFSLDAHGKWWIQRTQLVTQVGEADTDQTMKPRGEMAHLKLQRRTVVLRKVGCPTHTQDTA